MRAVIGSCTIAERPVFLVQDDTGVSVADSDGDLVCPSVIDSRDGVIGNGPTEGDGVFDFRYGPFTGGYPEAGVVHYYTYGEKVLSVEIDLRLKGRSIEESLRGAEVDRAATIVARLCGNFTVAHSLAFSRAVESVGEHRVNEATARLRLAALELERIYNHLYVVMRLASAAAQRVLHSHIAALYEETLRITAELSGIRGMREFIVPFGESRPRAITKVLERVGRVGREFRDLYRKSLSSRNYLDRLHGTAVLARQTALGDGLTGPSLRAIGIPRDLRVGENLLERFTPVTKTEGDALARMEVRAEEILDSCEWIRRLLEPMRKSSAMPPKAARDGQDLRIETKTLNGRSVGAAESPTGTVAWYVTLEDGVISHAYVSSPSVFGFQAYADSIVGNIFTDVPFAIDSFGVSFADAGR